MPLRLSWSRSGQGEEPLVLLHGIGSTRDDFAAVRPLLEQHFDVLAVDLPGHGRSSRLPRRPTIAAQTDALQADLDEMGLGRVHLLGNSLGARLALELAVRGRARSVVAVAPSGMNLPLERVYQGSALAVSRLLLRALRPLIGPAAGSTLGRCLLLAGLRSAPWRAGETEALALRGGFAEAEGFWSTWWWMLLDVPVGMRRIDVPVVLAQGTLDVVASGQTPRYLAVVPGSSFVPLWGAGHAPQSDTPGTLVLLVRRAAAAATVTVGRRAGHDGSSDGG